MFEQTKASSRRKNQSLFLNTVFVGSGIDIGAGSDPLTKNKSWFPLIENIREWDMPDGDAQFLATVDTGAYDFVHSSHCLEHMVNPYIALENWIRVTAPGGYLVITVPDEEMYERNQWPSRFNTDHKWSFRTTESSTLPKSINIHSFLVPFLVSCELVHVERLTDGLSQRCHLTSINQ